jgi:hypothetical protein
VALSGENWVIGFSPDARYFISLYKGILSVDNISIKGVIGIQVDVD